MTNSVQVFVDAAEQFCAWVEASPKTPEYEANQARRLVLAIYSAALFLPEPETVKDEAQDDPVPKSVWTQIYQRFAALPFNQYGLCFNPLTIPPEEPVIADLADDLADLYRHIKRGLDWFKKGKREHAVWHWRFQLNGHCGYQCLSSLLALHNWFETKSGAPRGQNPLGVGLKHMDIKTLNRFLNLFSSCTFKKFDLKSCEVVLEFQGDGGPGETVSPSLIFEDVRVMHLPRIIHNEVRFRIASETEIKEVIPASNYASEDGGKCFLIQSDGKDLGFYIWCESFRIEGIPSNWPYSQQYLT